MVKLLIYILYFGTYYLNASNIYEEKCVQCHASLPVSLDEMFKRYLLVYSGEENVKAGIKHYLSYPSKDISVMSQLFIDMYHIKEKSILTEDELNRSIDIYWETYKVSKRLK